MVDTQLVLENWFVCEKQRKTRTFDVNSIENTSAKNLFFPFTNAFSPFSVNAVVSSCQFFPNMISVCSLLQFLLFRC